MDGQNDPYVSIDAGVSFWHEDTNESSQLLMARENEVVIDYNKETKEFRPHGWDQKAEKEVELPFVKSVTAVGDMVKLEIVDAPLLSTLYSNDYDDATDFFKPWAATIPEKNVHVNARVRLAGPNAFKGKFAVSNVSVKIGDKVLSVDYNDKENLGDAWGDVEQNIGELKAASFNTSAVTVAKTKASVKAKKSVKVAVTTMFDGDKVTVSSSAKKVAKATYKKGKVTIKGLKKGKATVTVKANGKSKKIKVTVK